MTIPTHDETVPQQNILHSLDPLSAEEITRTTNILNASGKLTPGMRLMAYSLQEPPKEAILAFQPGQAAPPREVAVVIRDHGRHLTIEAIVSLTDEAIRSWHERTDVQPAVTYPEIFAAQQGRFIRMMVAQAQAPEDNYYAHPVEGVVATVEMDDMKVQIEDYGVVPVPPRSGNYTSEGIKAAANFPSFPEGTRTDLRPISITQAEGPSFQVEGYQVSWQKWRFRVGFSPREGLVLHLVEYFDRGRWRPIIYRAALSEMFVPYGDPTPAHNWKNVFDAGEVGIGVLANSLELGCDCLGEIYYFDAAVNDAAGQHMVLSNALCMHEEDFSILWKHLEYNEDGST